MQMLEVEQKADTPKADDSALYLKFILQLVMQKWYNKLPMRHVTHHVQQNLFYFNRK